MNVIDEDASIKRRRITGRATVVFITVMFLLTFFSKSINNFTLPKVTYETPASGALIKEVSGTGNIKANNIQDLYVSSSMKITGVMVDVGDSVKQGQTLLILDTSDIENQLEDELDKYAQKKLHFEELMEAGSPESMMSLDKAVQIARQNVEKAQKNYDSSKVLYEAGAITAINLTDAEVNLDNTKLDYEIAKNNKDKAISSNKRDIESTKFDISMAERKIAELTKEMNMSTVTAPCDGVVTELYYSAGMTANASQPLYRIADTGEGFQFVASVNISAVEYLESGDGAEITINSLNGKMIQGKVKQIRNNQQQIGVKKDVVIDIPLNGLVGGESGKADIKKNIGSYKTLVSNSAVGQDIRGYFVYVLKERKGPLGNEFYVQKVTVSIGDSDNTKTVVLSGINAMDKVISDSDKPLADGSPVMIAN
ncbi:efflux RND transporter periplasmic adaptor subunit [Geosporobacter ferrireducens]|uniref:RND transporter n=1 Tax=Geosporobacter ferrireducens TaxID=1424294 RepID=A0A1D8GBB6_9FIRM|nr:efflux RND transporter periplasmic adaptor subunit [Geosporobacter ferrireducens]AOT68188.1 RND transporter [Geosporobacter ferrireducens]